MKSDNDWKTWALGIAVTALLAFATMQIGWTREDMRSLDNKINDLDKRLTTYMLGIAER
jgi:hypothetical protein